MENRMKNRQRNNFAAMTVFSTAVLFFLTTPSFAAGKTTERLGSFAASGINTLDVSYGAGGIIFLPSETDAFVIEETTWDKTHASVNNNNGTLLIEGGKRSFLQSFSFFWDHSPVLRIHVPASYRGSYRVSLLSGNMSAQTALVSEGNVNISLLSGNVKLGAVSVKTLVIDMKSGNFAITESAVTENFSLHMTSGTAIFESVQGKGDVKVTSGNINLNLAALTGNLALAATSGNIRMSLSEKIPFNLDAEAINGNINVRSKSGKTQHFNRSSVLRPVNGTNPEHTITARVVSGNVNILLE